MAHTKAPTLADQAQDLAACAREPIHVPGSIQPHGVMLVIDPDTDQIMQSAGNVGALLGSQVSLPGRTMKDLLGVGLVDLVRQSGIVMGHEPAYIGTLGFDGREDVTLIAHRVKGAAVVEAMPAGPSSSVAATLANIRSITERINTACDVPDACRLAVVEVRRVTGYDRVMIYRFLPDGAGAVVAEAKDASLAAFLNHRYPESDIPHQARELYRRSAIRVIPDVSYSPAPLVPALLPTTGEPLDMSHCALRSVSPVHIQYLKNMGVGASMSVSLLPRGELWGLIACHNTTPKLLSYEAQEVCRHVGQILSRLIEAKSDTDADRMARKLGKAREKVIRALAAADEPGAIFDVCPSLQTIADSDGVAVCAGERVVTAGHAPGGCEVRQLASRIEPRLAGADYFVTDHLSQTFPDAAAFAAQASGLLAIRLPGDDPVILMWFRAEQVQEVMWAGNPHKPVETSSRSGALTPRTSFATWQETVRARSRPWAPADLESVLAFSPAAAFLLQQQKVRQLNLLLGEANRQLTTLASTDGLTGIPNRRAFDLRLHKEWARAGRSGQPLGLIILDLDFFKQFNDHFGHQAGDECLRHIAQILHDRQRATDFAARIGGEEFAVVLFETDIDGAMALAETTRRNIEKLRIEHPKSPSGLITASLGVACLIPDGTKTVHDMMRAADRALYQAKKQGRNQVVRL